MVRDLYRKSNERDRAQKGGGYVVVMRGIRRIPLMPPIPLCIGFTEDFTPQNEGIAEKLCSAR
jgi:hypothetical protein